ncbi:hypothetical protein KP509_10G007700 [Ceratopteris richardii]|nr:hypothetical protein KP509_10G007700 [Ceratopteris richardii]
MEDPLPNHTLRRMIQAWYLQHAGCGVDRLLTPRQPPSLKDLPHLIDILASAAHNSPAASPHDSLDALLKLARLSTDRPRTRRIIIHHGAIPILSKLLSRSFPGSPPIVSSVAAVPTPLSHTIADEAIKLLDLLVDPISCAEIDLQHLSCHEELTFSLVNALLRAATLDSRARVSTILTRLQPPLCLRRKIGELQGFIAALADMIREDDGLLSKPALGLLIDICEASNRNRTMATEVGAVETLARLLENRLQQSGGDENDNVEMVMKALELICQCAEGRAAVAADERIIAVIVKNINAAYERSAHHAFHILLLVTKYVQEPEKVKAAALREGALFKVICVAQSAKNSETRKAARRLASALSEAMPPEQLSKTMKII